jgi:hypothetical protein
VRPAEYTSRLAVGWVSEKNRGREIMGEQAGDKIKEQREVLSSYVDNEHNHGHNLLILLIRTNGDKKLLFNSL